MILALFAAAAIFATHAALSVVRGMQGYGFDWALGVFGAFFFGVCTATLGWIASATSVPVRHALAARGGIAVRGRRRVRGVLGAGEAAGPATDGHPLARLLP